MQKFWKLLVCAFVLLALYRCDRDKNPLIQEDVVWEPYAYPLKTGNEWRYTRTVVPNMSEELQNAVGLKDTAVSSLTMKITGEKSLADTIEAYEFTETIQEDGRITTSASYYSQGPAGFLFHGYTGPGVCIPKNGKPIKIQFRNRSFSSIQEIIDTYGDNPARKTTEMDSLIIESPPLLVYPSSIQVGHAWTYRSPGNPFMIRKLPVGQETIQTPAGTFQCMKIRWLYEEDIAQGQNILFYDYISDQGLVCRLVRYENIMIKEADSNSSGSFDMTDTIVLTGFSL
ncbi:hypothetical protein JW948_00920 [bacterium]|nr:hypothetical protein [bacterium]